jgi:peptide subunit release factor 1 (eRF1)
MTDAAKDIVNETTEYTQPEQLLEKLLEFESVSAPVISLYLDARVDQNGKRNFLPFVRKQLNERAKTYDNNTPERQSFDEDLVRIMRYLDEGIKTTANGVAIFACAGHNDFFEVGEFEAPFERNRVFVSDRPHVYPLARMVDQYRRYAVVLADTNRAHLFVFAAGRAVEEQTVENVKTKKTRVGGWSQARYQRRTVKDENIEHIILAGDETAVIPLLREQLPKPLEEKVIDALSLGIDTPEHELFD